VIESSRVKEKAIAGWSGGKDSALALYEIQKCREFEIASLLTTVTEDYDRISMHGVRRALLERQAESVGIPLLSVFISKDASEDEYASRVEKAMLHFKEQGVAAAVFGDLFLEDVRKYREGNLSKLGMKAVFPLWKRDTSELAAEFIHLDFKAVTTCVDSKLLDKKFVGRMFDESFLSELPEGVDPCGENGEFHSFVFDGPIFKKPVEFKIGEIVLREGRFYFCDLI